MDVASTGEVPTPEQLKLLVLQLQCIIDAKDREMMLLRKQLSSQEDCDEVNNLHAEILNLRGEVEQLTLERNVLRPVTIHGHINAASPHDGSSSCAPLASDSQAAARIQHQAAAAPGGRGPAPAYHNGGAVPGLAPCMPAGKVHGVALAERLVQAPQQLQPISPSVMATMDSVVLVDKLRDLVSGLVAEALSAQQQRPFSPSPTEPFLPQSRIQTLRTGGVGSPYADHHFNPAAHQAAAPHPQAPAAPLPLPALASPSDTAASGIGLSAANFAWPGIQIVVQQLPSVAMAMAGEGRAAVLIPAATTGISTFDVNKSAPSPFPVSVRTRAISDYKVPMFAYAAAEGPELTTAGSGAGDDEGRAQSAAAAALASTSHPGGNGVARSSKVLEAPAVLELNVDGQIVFVEREVLDAQAAGSRLHNMLICEYAKLPLDSQGRPFLSYNPGVFQLLISHLKECHLFGDAIAVSGPRDWGSTADSLGVSHAYIAQVALHFGLADLVPLAPHRPGPSAPSASHSYASSPRAPGNSSHGRMQPPPSCQHANASEPPPALDLHDAPMIATVSLQPAQAQIEAAGGLAVASSGPSGQQLSSLCVAAPWHSKDVTSSTIDGVSSDDDAVKPLIGRGDRTSSGAGDSDSAWLQNQSADGAGLQSIETDTRVAEQQQQGCAPGDASGKSTGGSSNITIAIGSSDTSKGMHAQLPAPQCVVQRVELPSGPTDYQTMLPLLNQNVQVAGGPSSSTPHLMQLLPPRLPCRPLPGSIVQAPVADSKVPTHEEGARGGAVCISGSGRPSAGKACSATALPNHRLEASEEVVALPVVATKEGRAAWGAMPPPTDPARSAAPFAFKTQPRYSAGNARAVNMYLILAEKRRAELEGL